LTAAGFEQPRYFSVNKEDFRSDRDCFASARNDVDFPVIVKPDTLGSSIGVSVAHDERELAESLELVFEMDDRAIVEEFFAGAAEINCAAMRAMGDVQVSSGEQVSKKRDFLDYESKYLDATSGFIKKGKAADEIPNFAEIQQLTRRAYELFGASGVVRADFLLRKETTPSPDGATPTLAQGNFGIVLNEINTVPGFLAYHLWARAGMPYGLVIDLITKQAIADAESARSLKTVFKSDILLKNRGLIR